MGLSTNDSHRLGLLLTQLLVDAKTKSVFASVLNVMGRNNRVSVRFPEFKDTRKNRERNVFNAWTDDKEPRSALGELFNKLIPLMQGMKKSRHRSFIFPPKSLSEMPAPPSTLKVARSINRAAQDSDSIDTGACSGLSVDLSDLDCNSRVIRPTAPQDIQKVVAATKHTQWCTHAGSHSKQAERLPLTLNDELDLEDLLKNNQESLFVFIFHATWCGISRGLHPLLCKLALSSKTARFVRIDIEGMHRLTARLEVTKVPTIKIVRPRGETPVTKNHVLGTLDEIDEDFVSRLLQLVASASTPEEVVRMNEPTSNVATEEQMAELSRCVAVEAEELAILSSRPLEQIMPFVTYEMKATLAKCPTLDVSRHAAAQSAVAQSMLKRMKDDVLTHLANQTPTPKLRCLSANVLQDMFTSENTTRRATTQKCVEQVEGLLAKLQQLRAQDYEAIQGTSHLCNTAANFIDLSAGGLTGRLERSKFVLRRVASAAAEVWPEFLYASILSSKGAQDLRRLNPYIDLHFVETVMQLVQLGMLRANRVGHLSRCIGATVLLLGLLRGALETKPALTSWAKFQQAADDVAGIISAGRHFVSSVEDDSVEDGAPAGPGAVRLDPRFLIFEFTWDILLRQKQVEIVHDFVAQVKSGNSKVKQMIMGAGKTTVVAPLLALILADSKSLLLSVVPKALLEMSRTQMRETFSNIITKRISTFKFERSTVPHEGMRLNLENSVRNRGIVVATPTSIKSVMLVYIETLRNLHEVWGQHKTGPGPPRPINREKIELLGQQAKELSGILKLFRGGVMLLDEVDMILHPLKSELNFPLGEKADLDCSESGERWSLPIHIVDAIFFAETSKASAFEARGNALNILHRIAAVLSQGYASRALQRLPHVTLLNVEWYHDNLKPVLAEWVYLWLQKNHLHGVSRPEAISYIVEGAVARSESTAKINSLEAAIVAKNEAVCINKNLSKQALKLLEAERAHLVLAVSHASEQRGMVLQLYELDEEQERLLQAGARRVSELQQQIAVVSKKIQEMTTPRDDSYDNHTILWCSTIFKTFNAREVAVSGEEAVVLTMCAKFEEKGFSVRRCGTQEEAAELAYQLRRSGHLRCIIAGGNAPQGCKRDCSRSHHNDGPCLVCAKSWGAHNSHTCSDGRLGSWPTRLAHTDPSSMDHFQFLSRLVEDVPLETKAALLPSRMMLFAGSAGSMVEDKRLILWSHGIHVAEDMSQLLEWVEGLGTWDAHSALDDTAAGRPADTSLNEATEHAPTLTALRERLHQLETTKEAVVQEEEAAVDELRKRLEQQHLQLDLSIQKSIDDIAALKDSVVKVVGLDPVEVIQSLTMGPTNGREAALSIAWLKLNVLDAAAYDTSTRDVTQEFVAKVKRSLSALSAELKWLAQAALAAKVMSRVTSAQQRKLLNLSYDWLRTFLPHILAKVNRVSFGLLSSKDCLQALEDDAMVPQSRLKLSVPFVGKDVPSKSSEFAHPDVILGLTILGYRYSGMRFEDFSDLIDSLSAEFSQEIGPPRDRPSSQRHEAWVLSAGGRIRGIKTTLNGLAQHTQGPAGGRAQAQGIEVVQLKFLQKSNVEQIQKLYQLWKHEPQAIHYYLSKFVFPAHMRSQKIKVSASGQALGGDMLVGRRVGFSGTPSDLLPKELGSCDYETGDDGRMLKTVLDQEIVSHELLPNDWSVQTVLARIAGAESPRYHALIDTGALITGYSNLEVAAFLLKKGLPWCDGVVFLDENDEKQVLVRATGRAVPADQCGVPLDKRFAFYDQIHTTGMDIKHVVNATAIITLGKDMTFRDYVQGAYRMRGIGDGQKIHVYIIPEVADLICREIRAANEMNSLETNALLQTPEKVLEALVAFLVINSMRTEQTQFSMLCMQNLSNIYQKNAFSNCLTGAEAFCEGTMKDGDYVTYKSGEHAIGGDGVVQTLPLLPSLQLFDETIDFSLEAAVPDPVPFAEKLRAMLTSHCAFIVSEEQHTIGATILSEVDDFTCANELNSGDESANLDTQQEREMEQEQEKEVKARKDQQIEVERFVEREYSRHQETPTPWSVSWLGCQPGSTPEGAKATEGDDPHPFYGLHDFHLLHQVPLPFPSALLLSRNYFNPGWSGLRRLKNVVCLLEWCPHTDPSRLRLITQDEHAEQLRLNSSQQATIQRVHTLLKDENGRLSREGLKEAVSAATNAPVDAHLLDTLWLDFGCLGSGVSAEGLQELLTSGHLFPVHQGRYWVAVSLAEAETLRRILHLRQSRPLLDQGATTLAGGCELALHMSQPGAAGLPGSTLLDASRGWRGGASGTGATNHEMSLALGCYRFFDGDMHYNRATLAQLVRALHQASIHDREMFFSTTILARRRMEKRWQETPLSSVFSIVDEWANLKQNAQAAFIRLALKRRKLTPWEAFVAFNADNNSRLSPSELYGALTWLEVPELTAEDVVDFFELADTNRDGMIDYAEYMALFEEDSKLQNRSGDSQLRICNKEDDDEDGEGGKSVAERVNKEHPPKIEPIGADLLRDIMVKRRKDASAIHRVELARRRAEQADLDIKLFREELHASSRREGGSNPKICFCPSDNHKPEMRRLVVFSFESNKIPLRTIVSGMSAFVPVLIDNVRKNLLAPQCKRGHLCTSGGGRRRYGCCSICNRYVESKKFCKVCPNYLVCTHCCQAGEDEQVKERSDPANKNTFIQCEMASDLTLHIPPPSVDLAREQQVDAVVGGGMSGSGGQSGSAVSVSRISEHLQAAAIDAHESSTEIETLSGDFSVTIELKLNLLPAPGQKAALVHFSSPDLSQARRRHMASLYCDSRGSISVDPQSVLSDVTTISPASNTATDLTSSVKRGAQPSGAVSVDKDNTKDNKTVDKDKREDIVGLRMREGRWMVLTASVQVLAGRITTYLDGHVISTFENLEPRDLSLGSRLMILGA